LKRVVTQLSTLFLLRCLLHFGIVITPSDSRIQMTSAMKEIDLDDIKGLENWYERFELYAMTHKNYYERE